MGELEQILESIKSCNACRLMSENNALGIPYVRIKPKPSAKVIFVGRDPSPRTAKIVGVREGKSVFIKKIFKIADTAGLSEDHVYITDLCKCHWRTSVGKPIKNTQTRSATLDKSIAKVCLNKWLLREIQILRPKLVVSFGEELYQLLRPLITNPSPPPKKFSATADKSVLDAEYWFAHNGPLTFKVNNMEVPLAVLRHPGNSTRLRQRSSNDLRLVTHQKATQRVIDLIKA